MGIEEWVETMGTRDERTGTGERHRKKGM